MDDWYLNGFLEGFEGESDHDGLFYAWDDRVWVAQEDQGLIFAVW